MIAMRLAAGAALYAAGALVVLISPVFVGAMAERFALDAAQIGLLAGGEATGGVVASLTSPYWLARVDQRSAAIAALIVMIAGAAAAAVTPTFEALLLVRLITSVAGGGVAYAVGIAWLSAAQSPDRAFAIGGGVQALAPALLLIVSPILLKAGGLTALMGAVALLFACALIVTAATRHGACTVRISEGAQARVPFGAATIALLVSAFALAAATQAYWAFADVLGSESGIPGATISNALALAAMAGLPAAALAAWCAQRIGARASFRIGTAGFALALGQLAFVAHPLGFVAAAIAVFFFSVFLTPFQFGALTRADAGSPRSAALAPAAQSVGVMVGPLVAGQSAAAASTFLAAVWVAIALLALNWIGFESAGGEVTS